MTNFLVFIPADEAERAVRRPYYFFFTVFVFFFPRCLRLRPGRGDACPNGVDAHIDLSPFDLLPAVAAERRAGSRNLLQIIEGEPEAQLDRLFPSPDGLFRCHECVPCFSLLGCSTSNLVVTRAIVPDFRAALYGEMQRPSRAASLREG
jgi:hypothetical protein